MTTSAYCAVRTTLTRLDFNAGDRQFNIVKLVAVYEPCITEREDAGTDN